MEAQKNSEYESPKCHTQGCRKDAIVFLAGRPLCYEHYVENLNELNEMGLTPRGLTEDAQSINGTRPVERLVREPAHGPERKPVPPEKP